jgi:hypothetical protein
MNDSNIHPADEHSGPISALETLIKSPQHICRLELEDTAALERFEADMVRKTSELMKIAELAGLRPSFVWWQIRGLWPRADGGWTLLVRKSSFTGTAEAPSFTGDAQRAVGRQ